MFIFSNQKKSVHGSLDSHTSYLGFMFVYYKQAKFEDFLFYFINEIFKDLLHYKSSSNKYFVHERTSKHRARR